MGVTREITPNELNKIKKTKNPRVRMDLLWVRWRTNRKAQGAVARMPRYSIFFQKADKKMSRKKTPTWETKIARLRPTKEACSLSFLPVIIKETAIIKLVAARVNVSISSYYSAKAKKANKK